eukprot:EG_transcript_30493
MHTLVICMVYMILYVRPVSSVEEILTLDVQRKVYAAALSPATQVIWSTSGNDIVSWTAAGHVGDNLTGHTASVLALALSTNGWRLLSAGEDRTMILWDLHNGTKLQTFANHSAEVTSVAFLADHLVASGSADGTVNLWNASGDWVQTLRHPPGVRALAASPAGDVLVSVGGDATAHVWAVPSSSGLPQFNLTGQTQAPVAAVAYSADG